MATVAPQPAMLVALVGVIFGFLAALLWLKRDRAWSRLADDALEEDVARFEAYCAGVEREQEVEQIAAYAAYCQREHDEDRIAALEAAGYFGQWDDMGVVRAPRSRLIRSRPRERRARCARSSRTTAGTSSSDDPHELPPPIGGYTWQEHGRRPVMAR